MANRITDRQREVLAFVVSFVRSNGYPPTLREIGAALKIRSTNGVSDHLSALERKGLLVCSNTKARGIRVVSVEPSPANVIPIGGARPKGDAATVDEARALLGVLDGDPVLPRYNDTVTLVRRLALGLIAQAERRRLLSDADRAALVGLYTVEHESVSQLAKAFGVSSRTVRSELKRAGVTMRPRGRPRAAQMSEAA